MMKLDSTGSKVKPRTSKSTTSVRNRRLFGFAMGLLVAMSVYSTGWALIELLVMMRVWPEGLWNWDAYGFFASLNWQQQVAFYSSLALSWISVGLMYRRSALAVPVFLISFILYRIDSLILSTNVLFNGIAGFPTFGPILIIQLLLTTLIINLWAEGVLDRDQFWKKPT